MVTTENRGAGDPGAPEREFHPLAGLFPLMTGAAFDELVADIKANGLREPILLDRQGRILDGRNRYRACRAAGVEPRYVTWEGEEGGEAELVLSLNLHRRHLNESQRAMVAARMAKMLEKEAVKRKSRLVANLHPARRGRSASEGAAMVNVSPRLVIHAIKVLRDGCAELIAAVDGGVVAVSTAVSLAGLPAEEQAKVVAGGATEIAARVRQLRHTATSSATGSSPRPFGVLYQKSAVEAGAGGVDGGEPVVLLWVPSSALAAAIAALRTHGFQYAASER